MMRVTVEGILLFLLPFAVYATLIVLGPRLGRARLGPISTPTLTLAACGIALVVLALVALGLFGDRSRGIYVPAHLENGRLVPGQMR